MKKKILASVLAILIFALSLPLLAMAASYRESSYMDVDYSTVLTVGTETTVDGSTDYPYISMRSWSGFAKGFTVTLEAGKSYGIIAARNREVGACYLDTNVAVLTGGTLCGTPSTDVLLEQDGKSAYNATSVRKAIIFTPEASGDYRILSWGYCQDVDDNELFDYTVTLNVVEAEENYTKDIKTAQDLLDAQAEISEGLRFYNNTTLNFLADIDMTGKAWTPIRPEASNEVTVNGNGYTVTGLSDMLFNEVKKLTVSDLTLAGYNANLTDVYCHGALAGYAEVADLDNCHVSGKITVVDDEHNGIYNLGGLIGALDGYINENDEENDEYILGGINNCSADIEITATSNDYVEYIGGLIGYGYCYANFRNCSATGSITVNVSGSNYAEYIGGFAGYFEDYTICNNCEADVDITVNTQSGEADGDNTVITVRAQREENNVPRVECIGGFTGYIDEDCGFFNCSSAGSITVNGPTDYFEYIGGFNGCSDCCGGTLAVNCYSITDIALTVNNSENYAVGRFFGSTDYDDTFKNCYAAGDFIVLFEDGTSENGAKGFFIGQNTESEDSIVLENCYVDNGTENPAPLYSDYNNYAVYERDGLNNVDFTDNEAVNTMTDSLNNSYAALVDECSEFTNEVLGDKGFNVYLSAWGGKNVKNGPIFMNRTVRFLDEEGKEVETLTDLYDGQDFSNSVPEVPAKEGYTGKWDIDEYIVDGDMIISLVYEKNSTQDPVDPTDPTNQTDPTNPSDQTNSTDSTNQTDPTNPSNQTNSTDSTNQTAPKTGDNSNVFLWLALLFVSGGALAGITVYEKRRKTAE